MMMVQILDFPGLQFLFLEVGVMLLSKSFLYSLDIRYACVKTVLFVVEIAHSVFMLAFL